MDERRGLGWLSVTETGVLVTGQIGTVSVDGRNNPLPITAASVA